MPKWLPKGRRDIWENLALGSLGAYVAHKVAQVARTQNPQNLTFEHQGMETRNRPAKGCPQPSKCKPLSLENGAQTTDKNSQIGPELR